MFQCLRHLVSAIAAFVVILAMGMATPARADLEIWISEGSFPGGGNNVADGSGAATYNATFGGNLAINMTAASNGTGSVSVSNATITNQSSSSITFYILVGANGFANPSQPFNVLSSVSGTGSPSSFSFMSYVNNSNGQNATSGGAQGPNSGSNSGSQAMNSSTTFSVQLSSAANVPKYSMTEDFKITLGAGTSITFNSSTADPPSAPEPSSMAIAGIGGLGMVGFGLRRRKALGD